MHPLLVALITVASFLGAIASWEIGWHSHEWMQKLRSYRVRTTDTHLIIEPRPQKEEPDWLTKEKKRLEKLAKKNDPGWFQKELAMIKRDLQTVNETRSIGRYAAYEDYKQHHDIHGMKWGKYESGYVPPPKPPEQIPNAGIGNVYLNGDDHLKKNIFEGTEKEYDDLKTYDCNTIYFITR